MCTTKLSIMSFLVYFYSIDETLFVTGDFDFRQNAYNVDFERVQVVWFDKAVYDNYEIVTFKYNRTVATYNLTATLRVDKPAIKIICHCLKLSGNEYKLTAIQFEMNGCSLLKLGKFGLKTLKTNSNITECPLRKGTYSLYNAYFDSRTLPPHFPEGHWKFQVNEVINKAVSLKLDFYINVIYPVKYGRK